MSAVLLERAATKSLRIGGNDREQNVVETPHHSNKNQ
jgi:hypothetical protein